MLANILLDLRDDLIDACDSLDEDHLLALRTTFRVLEDTAANNGYAGLSSLLRQMSEHASYAISGMGFTGSIPGDEDILLALDE